MKKLLTTLVVVIMAATLAIGMTACGNEEAKHTHEYSTAWSSDETNHWHACTADGDCDAPKKDETAHTWNDGEITTPATAEVNGVKTFTCSVCNKTKTESVKYALVTTVTAEEWATAFDLPSVDNMTIRVVCSFDSENEERMNEYDGVNWYQKTVTGESNRERYYHLTGGKNEYGAYYCEVYSNDTGEWQKLPMEQYIEGDVDKPAHIEPIVRYVYFDEDGYVDISTAFSYAAFTYSEVDKAYKCASCTETVGTHGDFDYTDVVVKFEDGKLVYVECETDGIKIQLFIYNYGTTVVTLPVD